MASHATNTSIPGLTQARVQAITMLVVNLASTISAGLALAGLNPLPFTSDQVSAGVLGVIALLSAVYNWWTHLTVTQAGYEGKQLTTALKTGGLNTTTPQNASQDDGLSRLYETDTDGTIILDTVTGTPVINVKG
ncbi:phage holin [Bifidobacterium sp. SO4]|uniref:phage holin n=1 Tax=Bifidobacterium sp. SO4 TaxID=2809030 RepID=UPI001BDDC6D5|nr:phage holin [Bifidobacterium sp. SO4]MBT1171258.1 hypothetical protein [Bifidobacterium sp. SO4]